MLKETDFALRVVQDIKTHTRCVRERDISFISSIEVGVSAQTYELRTAIVCHDKGSCSDTALAGMFRRFDCDLIKDFADADHSLWKVDDYGLVIRRRHRYAVGRKELLGDRS